MFVRFKILVAMILGGISISILAYFQSYSQEYFEQYRKATLLYNQLHLDHYRLKHQVLYSSTALYFNNDTTRKLIEEITKHTTDLRNNIHRFSANSKTMLNEYTLYLQAQEELLKNIERFLTLNGAIKNSVTILPTLAAQSFQALNPSFSKDAEAFATILQMQKNVLMAKAGNDISFLNDLKKESIELARLEPNLSNEIAKISQNFNAHISFFLSNFLEYDQVLLQILDDYDLKVLEKAYMLYSTEQQHSIAFIEHFALSLQLLFMLTIALIIYFLFQAQRENKKHIALQEQLRNTLHYDALTQLHSRAYFENESHHQANETLILLNIDNFKHINNFFGTQVGDFVLQETAKRLPLLWSSEHPGTFFRLGGDDFGILVSNISLEAAKENSYLLLKAFNANPILFGSLEIDLNLSASVSKHLPLLETADMALKELKKNHLHNLIVYNPELDLLRKISTNIETAHLIKQALQHEGFIPFFQPILHLPSNTITKYESLVRLKLPNGELLSPYYFLSVAKSSQSYFDITKLMVTKTFEFFKNYPYSFSINLSMLDLNNEDIKEYIFDTLKSNPQTAQRATFEILESENIHNYLIVKEFITQIKTYGASVAIDDFGSGYSNFVHIANLHPDFLKIDGSLIKNIHRDEQVYIIVKTIVAFARQLNIEVVAEYVENQEILNLLNDLNVSYGQGYYIAQPAEGLIEKTFACKPEDQNR